MKKYKPDYFDLKSEVEALKTEIEGYDLKSAVDWLNVKTNAAEHLKSEIQRNQQ